MTGAALADWIEANLTITQGRFAGEPMRVLPWMRDFLDGLYPPDPAAPAPAIVGLSVPRGQAKTALCAALAAAAIHPTGLLTQPNAITHLVASSFAQAAIGFRDCLAYMGPIIAARRYRVVDNSNTAFIRDVETGAEVKCLAANPRKNHGLRLGPITVCDEPAQWEPGTGERMNAALRTARGKLPGSRLVFIGTRPDSGDHHFARTLETADFSMVFAADPDDPWDDPATWARANPSWDYFPDLREAIEREAELAARDASMLPAFKALRLNLGVSDSGTEQVLLEPDSWRAIEREAVERRGPYVLALDLGTNASMTAAAAFWPATGGLDCFAVWPKSPSLASRGRDDGVGNRYQLMAQRGELMQAGALVADVGAMLRMVVDRWGAPSKIVADRWREAELREALQAARFPRCRLALRGGGFKDGAEDVRRFRRRAVAQTMHAPASLLLRSAMADARVVADVAANAKLAAKTQGGRRAKARDDAVSASVLAVAEGDRMQPAAPAPGDAAPGAGAAVHMPRLVG